MSVPPYAGAHASNTPLTAEHWFAIGLSGARWLKLLAEDHLVADARLAQSAGLRVIVRAPGEGIVHWEAVAALIGAYAGACDWIECGNEPYPTAAYPTWPLLLWNHAQYLEWVADRCLPMAHAAGIRLCAPGWPGATPVPLAGAPLPGGPNGRAPYVLEPALATRLRAVYSRFDGVAIHAYDAWSLVSRPVSDHVWAWAGWLPDLPILLTEYGIAGALAPDVRAARYAAFLAWLDALTPRLVAACAFLVGGSPEYNGGLKCYGLGPAACAALGAAWA